MVRDPLRLGWELALAATLAVLGCDESAPLGRAPGQRSSDPAATPSGTTNVTARASADGSGAAAPGLGAAAASASPSPHGPSPDGGSGAVTGTPVDAGALSANGAATAQEEATVVRGSEQTTDAYAVWLQSMGAATVGRPATVQAVLTAKGGYKCNEKYPYKFKLEAPPAGLSYPQRTVRGIQYGPQRSVLNIPFAASRAGTYTISGVFRFSVCTKERCIVQKQSLSAPVKVE